MTTLETYGEVEYTRGRDFFDPLENEHSEVTIVGCGGIGSFAAHALAKLGLAKINLVDFDTVEAHNIPNQLFTKDDVGQEKSVALGEALALTTNADITPWVGRVTEDEGLVADGGFGQIPLGNGVVISALDSMEARANLWSLVRMRYTTPLFIDGRLGGQNVVVYAVNPVDLADIKGYEATLHSDEDGLEQPCTGRNVIDVGYSMAALITRLVRGHYADEALPKMVYQDQEALTLATVEEWLL